MLQLWTLGVIINLLLFYSIFDIYFKSPIVPVDRRHRLDEDVVQAPFKRVVFFGADGLRAETFFQYPERRPYLSKIMEEETSVWGISDTRVPTESRPGHVALLAGFYEDPSAVFTGWQENTVEFDSIFNQTSSSIALGSRDIVNIFVKGAAKSKMLAAHYPPEWQDFMGENLTKLDSWVFDSLTDLTRNKSLPEENGVIIFLHMLGIDTVGHSSKPHSEAYKFQMEFVDDIIRKTEKMIDEYYGDKSTLYVYTSDHGMTNWGSHGDGSLHETETPFVVWGPGIRKHTKELRLQQADFAALMAGCLGVGFPSNSVGRFPESFWTNRRFSFEALKANFFQIRDLMYTKRFLIESNRNFPLILFEKEELIQHNIKSAEGFSTSGDLESGVAALNEAIKLSLEGMLYYERYDQQLLVLFTVSTTFSWMLFVALVIIRINSAYNEIKGLKIYSGRYATLSLIAALVLTKGIIGWSLWRIPYGFFPVYLVLLTLKLVQSGISGSGSVAASVSTNSGRVAGNFPINSLFLLLVFCALGVEILANSFESRSVLSLGLVLNAIWCVHSKKVSSWQKTLFFVAVAFLAIFPMMPVIGKERNLFFMSLGPLASTSLASIFLYIRNKSSKRDNAILGGQMILLALVSVLCHYPSFLITRVIAWLSVIQSYFLPVFVSAETVTCRLISMFLAIATPFSFISFSYEALFFPSLFLVLLILIKLEMSEENLEDSWAEFLNLSTESRDRRKLWERVDLQQAVRRAWLHLFFVTLSFFGTGNIASINSFDPSSTRCFVSVFSPWIMMLVLIEKILGPFLLVSCFFRRLLWSKFQVERSFLIVLLLCQGMTLHTFFQVKNQGSWLEIGTSISHHVIVSATTLFLFILHFIADFLMSFEPWPSSAKSKMAIPTVAKANATNISQSKSTKVF